MRFSLPLRTTLFFLLVGAAPLGLAAYSSVKFSEEAQNERLSRLHIAVTHLLAERIAAEVEHDGRAVRLAAAAIATSPSSEPEELARLLDLVLRDTERASAIALVGTSEEEEALEQRSEMSGEVDPEGADRVYMRGIAGEDFLSSISLETARASGFAIGRTYTAADQSPRIAIAARSGSRLLAIEFDLDNLSSMIAKATLGSAGRTFVVDSTGRAILDTQEAMLPETTDRWSWEPVRMALVGASGPVRYDDPVIGDALGSGAKVPRLDWAVIATEPYADAHAVTTEMKRRLRGALLLALLMAIVLGLFFSRALVMPIRRLSLGARAIAGGDLSHRVAGAARADELGDLARVFNEMAEELERWNREIEERVEAQRTSLKEAELILARSVLPPRSDRKLAEIAEEIESPAVTILGMSQLLADQELPGTQTRDRLERIQELAARLRELSGELQRLAGAKPDERIGRA